MKTKILLSLIISLIALSANAYDFKVDGIYYNKNSNGKSVTVTYYIKGFNNYTSSVTIPEKVTYSGVTYSVTSIGDYAFMDCSRLTKVTIPNSVTSIGNAAFSGCSGLASITIPDSVTSIGSSVFSWCTGLTSITIGKSVTSIGDYTFNNCTGLTSVTIPNSVTSIGDYAFMDCSRLTKVTIPNSVTSIGNAAFSGCSGLASITIPDSVTSIGSSVFSRCTGLTSITIGNSVTSIGDYTFNNCTSLTRVTIPNSVTSIGKGAFSGCSGLASVTVDINNPFYDSRKNCNAIIKSSNNSLIAGCKNTIIPNSVTSIGNAAFSGCSGLTSITIPNSVTSIANSAFKGCTGLTSITIPNSVTSIGMYAFQQCTGLTSITIPNSVTSIEYGTFYDCTGLTSITIPSSVTSIGERAFYDCTGLTSVTIPNSVTSIGERAFYDCTGLTSVTIGNSVTSIDYDAFFGCSGLASITVEVGNMVYDSRDNCNAIIETSSKSLILGCKNTIIPNSVTSIGSYAFFDCSGLTSVTIPNSVTYIGDFAFDRCSSLTNLYSHRTTPPSTGNDVFRNIASDATLHVMKGCTDSYRNADGWKEFTTILDDLNPTDLVTSISLNKKELELNEWTTASTKLIATVLPDNATNKAIKWTTSNATVATVNDGLVQGRDPGTAYIIVSTVDGSNLSDTCVVTVKPQKVLVQKLTLNKNATTIETGNTEQLIANVLPNDATNKQVEWSSDNTAVATVGTNGVVTAVAPGNATITVKTTDGSNLTATCKVTVTAPEPEFVTGDANGDGFVRINDVVTTSNYILGDEPAGFVFAAADVNQDGFVRINDVVLIANIILDGGMNAPAKVAAMQLAGNDYMTAQGVEIKAGETRFIDIELNNDNAFSALQMDINLPDGLVLKGATLTGRADGHNLMTGRTVNGKATIAAFSTESNNFAGNNGAVIRLEVMAASNVTEDITLDNIFASTARGELKQLDAVSVGVNAVTGINDITVGNGLVNVYNTAGQLVRRNANASEATRNLPAGLYLVGGKKVVVK